MSDKFVLIPPDFININSPGCRAETGKLSAFMSDTSGEFIDKLGALCLAVGFLMDHGVSDDDKQAMYELTLRTLAKIMKVAPGVNR